MKLFKEPKNVDFSTKSSPLTEEEHKEISEFIQKRKASFLAGENRTKTRNQKQKHIDIK